MSVFRVAPFGPTPSGRQALMDCKANVHIVDEGGSSALSLAMSVQKRRASGLPAFGVRNVT